MKKKERMHRAPEFSITFLKPSLFGSLLTFESKTWDHPERTAQVLEKFQDTVDIRLHVPIPFEARSIRPQRVFNLQRNGKVSFYRNNGLKTLVSNVLWVADYEPMVRAGLMQILLAARYDSAPPFSEWGLKDIIPIICQLVWHTRKNDECWRIAFLNFLPEAVDK